MSKAIRIDRNGGPEELKLCDVEVPAPPPGQVVVRQTAVGINFIDVYHRTGLYPLPAIPGGIGLEAVGVVEALGEGVSEVREGQRVGYAGGPPGAYAERRCFPSDKLIPLPDGVEDETAAAVLLKGMTAEFLIRRTYEVKAGDIVLFHAAAGGVGLLACQWLAHLGATVIGTVGSDEKAELARQHGCAHVVVYTRENFVERVTEITEGRGVPVVYDSVGRATFMGSLDCLQPRGLFVGYGNASGKPDPLDLGILAQKGSLYVTRPTLFTYTAAREDLLASAASLFAEIAAGSVKPLIGQRWPLAEAAKAHRALEARETRGSSLLTL